MPGSETLKGNTITEDPLDLLKRRFAMESFREGQREVIQRILAGKNVAAVFPTGGGKSLCYQLPALLLPGTTVIVSPLIALMKDQCDALAAKGIPAARLDSTLSSSQFAAAMNGIRDGSIKMLYVAPERFFNERFLSSMGTLDVSLFAIDEAHCISQWGHNFRPDYLKLAELTRDLCVGRVLALTATATPEVLQDIREAFDIDADDAIRTPFYRSNLHLRSTIVDSKTHYDVLRQRIQSRPRASTLVYVTLQRTAEEVAQSLCADGFPATAYHAGLDSEERASIQQKFIESNDEIVVATIAFGMGIDKSNIRYVYHFNPSKSLEAYAQEVGRAGRDGETSTCETLLRPDDRIVLENFAYGDTPALLSVRRLIDFVAGQPDTFHVSYYHLAAETDIRQSVVQTLLTYMELDGYFKATSPRYDTYKIKPLATSQSILKNFTGEPRQFLAEVFGCLSKGRTQFLLNMTTATKRLGVERDRIVKAIEHCSEKGWIEINASDLVYGYRRLKPIADTKTLADAYAKRLMDRESSEISRIDAVIDLIAGTRCQSMTLSGHFDDPTDEVCGSCSFCIGEAPHKIPAMGTRSIGTSAKRLLEDAIAKYPDRLVTARERARFLCGLSSPGFTSARLSREPGYGVCERVPFADVLSQVS
jgi:ATP-dependent DNA helicase RecQ